MSKLHSLIDHLTDQEKGYMDLLTSFNRFQQMASSLYAESSNASIQTISDSVPTNIMNNSLVNSSMSKRDILDLSEINESGGKQPEKKQALSTSELFRKRDDYLSTLNAVAKTDLVPNATSPAKSVGVQTVSAMTNRRQSKYFLPTLEKSFL